MSRKIVVTSGKGGVGKTTVVANVGTGLASTGKKVVVVDADIGLRNLDLVLGLENRIVFDLVDVVEGTTKLHKALIKDKKYANLCLLPAAQTRDKEAVSPEQMRTLCAELAKEFDYVILDCPAGIDHGFKNAIAGASEAIIVATPEVASIRDADRVIGLIEAEGIKDLHLIINRVRPEMVKSGDMLDIQDVMDILSIHLYGVVPDDQAVVVATNKGESLFQNGNAKAASAFKNIIRRIEGEDVPLLQLVKMESFWEKLKRFFTRKTS